MEVRRCLSSRTTRVEPHSHARYSRRALLEHNNKAHKWVSRQDLIELLINKMNIERPCEF